MEARPVADPGGYGPLALTNEGSAQGGGAGRQREAGRRRSHGQGRLWVRGRIVYGNTEGQSRKTSRCGGADNSRERDGRRPEGLRRPWEVLVELEKESQGERQVVT